MLGSSKRGDFYVRMLLIHCARSVILCEGWVHELIRRRSHNVAAVGHESLASSPKHSEH